MTKSIIKRLGTVKMVMSDTWSSFYNQYVALPDEPFLFACNATVASTLTDGKVSASLRGLGTKGTRDFMFLDGNGNIYSMRLSDISASGATVSRCSKCTMSSI